MTAIQARRLIASMCVLMLGACGGGGGSGGGGPQTPTFTIGGAVSGLSGAGLVLQNNGGANLAVSANGAYTFATQVQSGGAYNVTVLTQPTSPSQTCTVANGAGTVSANVTNVAITCTTNAFPVGGTVSGLAGAGLVLINNGGDNLTLGANGAFNFATNVTSGATYDVRVLTQPSDPVQNCAVTSGSGTVGNGAVTSLAINCITPQPRFAYSLDYNDRSVSMYAMDAATGQLRGRGSARVGVRPVDAVGYGVVHGSVGRFAYILNRGSATISAFVVDGVTGDFTEIAGSPYATGAPADGAMRISIHPSQRFIYVANGSANNIAAFRVNETTGELTTIAGSPFAAGTFPNYAAIDARGAFAYVANRDSHDIYTYRIDANTGALTEVANSRVSTGPDSRQRS